MRGNSHVRFGERAEETDRLKGQPRASARLDHTHGSLLIQAGIPIKVVSERLGHANIAFTIQTYQHQLPGMQEDAADTAERLATPVTTDRDVTVERRRNTRKKAA
jgi:integrase